MSGGSHGYIYGRIEDELVGQMHDRGGYPAGNHHAGQDPEGGNQMRCHKPYDPCPKCPRKWLVQPDTTDGEPEYFCFDTEAEARACYEQIERTNERIRGLTFQAEVGGSFQARGGVKMTITEAIQHCREEAAKNRTRAVEHANAYDWENAEACHECAAEHEQLAAWLEELQRRRGRAKELAALENLRQRVIETGRLCAASGVRAAIQTLIDLTNEETIKQEEGGA